jgi:hypothetical protein
MHVCYNHLSRFVAYKNPFWCIKGQIPILNIDYPLFWSTNWFRDKKQDWKAVQRCASKTDHLPIWINTGPVRSSLVLSQLDCIQDVWWENCQIWIWRMAHIQFRWVSQSVTMISARSVHRYWWQPCIFWVIWHVGQNWAKMFRNQIGHVGDQPWPPTCSRGLSDKQDMFVFWRHSHLTDLARQY